MAQSNSTTVGRSLYYKLVASCSVDYMILSILNGILKGPKMNYIYIHI